MLVHISFSENISCANTSYSRMLLFNGYVGYADYIRKLFSMHFYTNWELERPLILTWPVVTLSISQCMTSKQFTCSF